MCDLELFSEIQLQFMFASTTYRMYSAKFDRGKLWQIWWKLMIHYPNLFPFL